MIAELPAKRRVQHDIVADRSDIKPIKPIRALAALAAMLALAHGVASAQEPGVRVSHAPAAVGPAPQARAPVPGAPRRDDASLQLMQRLRQVIEDLSGQDPDAEGCMEG